MSVAKTATIVAVIWVAGCGPEAKSVDPQAWMIGEFTSDREGDHDRPTFANILVQADGSYVSEATHTCESEPSYRTELPWEPFDDHTLWARPPEGEIDDGYAIRRVGCNEFTWTRVRHDKRPDDPEVVFFDPVYRGRLCTRTVTCFDPNDEVYYDCACEQYHCDGDPEPLECDDGEF
mgnify:CR=1 FL=1